MWKQRIRVKDDVYEITNVKLDPQKNQIEIEYKNDLIRYRLIGSESTTRVQKSDTREEYLNNLEKLINDPGLYIEEGL